MRRIIVDRGRAAGVELTSGERLEADAVVFNGDISALDAALSPVPATRPAERSLSAITWCLHAATSGFPLAHHNVFFAEDYAAEFNAIFRARRPAAAPTVYLCAQDRGETGSHAEGTPERLLALINAPADGDGAPIAPAALAAIAERSFAMMRACGLEIDHHAEATVTTTPAEFHTLFPGTGGALYGRANHGASGSFARAGSTAKLPGLYLAGGSVHPGPGIPMAALSGRLAAARLLQDRAGRRTLVSFAPAPHPAPPRPGYVPTTRLPGPRPPDASRPLPGTARPPPG